MSPANRRTFLGQIGSAAIAVPALGRFGAAASQAAPTSASSGHPAVLRSADSPAAASSIRRRSSPRVRDVAIAGGRIARVAENIPPSQARQVYDAKGKIVTPGLIDMHTHVYRYGDHAERRFGRRRVPERRHDGARLRVDRRRHVLRVPQVRDGRRADAHLRAAEHLDHRPGRDQRNLSRSAHDQRASGDRDDRSNRDRIMGVKVRINGQTQRSGARPRSDEDGA